MAAATVIFNIAQTLFHYTNQSCSSKTRIHSAAPADECFSHPDTRLPPICHSHLLMMTAYLLAAARGRGLWESQGFLPRRNKHRAASRWCCHPGKLFLEKQEKRVGWAAKSTRKLKQVEESSVIKEVKKIPMSAKIQVDDQMSPPRDNTWAFQVYWACGWAEKLLSHATAKFYSAQQTKYAKFPEF